MIELMKKENLYEYAELFSKVFNGSPWNENWIIDTSYERLSDIMNTPKSFGLANYIDNKLVGFIIGHSMQYYDGVHFEISEFCVDNSIQGKGIGSNLINEFLKALESKNILKVYLLTIRGEKTEGFYNKRGFSIPNDVIYMCK